MLMNTVSINLLIWILHFVHNYKLKSSQCLLNIESFREKKLYGFCYNYNPVSSTTDATWSTVFLSAVFSSSVKSISSICSIPSQPITQGTPMKYPSTSYSPSHSAAEGMTRFLSFS